MKVWQILVTVALGAGYALLEPGSLTYAFGKATLYIFLPPLLFEAAWNLSYRAMVRQWRAIAVLVVPGVAITAVFIAGSLAIARIPFATALLTGAILSATDPIAVVAVFRRIPVPRTLSTIVECEALFNDAVCVLLYRTVVVLSGSSVTAFGLLSTVSSAVLSACAGVAIGVAAAFVVAHALSGARARSQILGTLLCAYGSYFCADLVHASGIFATIASGIALRYFERRRLNLSLAADVSRFWDVSAIVANVLVFFLVGAALSVPDIVRYPWFVAFTLLGVAVSRAAVSGLLLPAGFPRSWLDVIRIAGLRGALSLALAIALPETVPYRTAIIAATFAATLATLIVSGPAIAPVVQRANRDTSRGRAGVAPLLRE